MSIKRRASIAVVSLLFSSPLFLSAQTNDKVRVVVPPSLSSIGFFLAQSSGFFKQEKIDVELVDVTTLTSDMLPANLNDTLSNGKLDVAMVPTYGNLFSGMQKPGNYKIVAGQANLAPNNKFVQLIVRKDHFSSGRYKDLKSLKGMRIGISSINSPQKIIVEKILKKAGLALSDVQLISYSPPQMNIAFKAALLDAALQNEPSSTKAVSQDLAQAVLSASEVHPSQQYDAVFYSAAFMKKRDLASRFMKAYLKGTEAYQQFLSGKNPRAGEQIRSFYRLDRNEFLKMNTVNLPATGEFDFNLLKEDLAWYKTNKVLQKDLSQQEVVDFSFLPSKAAASPPKK